MSDKIKSPGFSYFPAASIERMLEDLESLHGPSRYSIPFRCAGQFARRKDPLGRDWRRLYRQNIHSNPVEQPISELISLSQGISWHAFKKCLPMQQSTHPPIIRQCNGSHCFNRNRPGGNVSVQFELNCTNVVSPDVLRRWGQPPINNRRKRIS